ncbi:acetolactate synthase, small subunit [Bacteroides coprosuis DSM 18011]|uniref:Acetolactate synthase small subunit n=1 Tax=Bacteroides coprosuis DSM 18011 TaxID=679937 RepID=F3ZQX0_9BACE|nr:MULTISPECIES: acetolactate synthase small subunit [Bacteroides]EGJ71843.1 acetolactate synthase, small subunit [Bacteroides coprosuis DSM 18011]HJD93029.1 acetolactate synthase small subunit [Bacteroides coprosuis]
MEKKDLYTLTVFSENTVGVLNMIASIFTRRQMNIETLSVSPSAIQGIHKFTITTFVDAENTVRKLVAQIDKKVDILKAFYHRDSELIYQELALYKIKTQLFLESSGVEELIRKHHAIILDISDHSTVIQKTGHYEETQALFEELSEKIGVLQFIRSGRVAITRSKEEHLSNMLAHQEAVLVQNV